MACEPDYVYVTHYSRVEDLQRLAADMHQCIDDYVAMALEVEQEHAAAGDADSDRQQALETKMFEYMCERLALHGFKGDRDTVMSIMQIDVTLNSQGLDVWLNRRKKNQE